MFVTKATAFYFRGPKSGGAAVQRQKMKEKFLLNKEN